ncbi:MAG: carbon-nitrogen hydrolase family protein [Armatimonadota bacterium]|nr:MAG: carbon-nitrogen hydrolase family protein [Armatimonadota bacterium]
MSRVITVTAIQLPAAKAGETPHEIKEHNLRRIDEGLAIAGERGSDVAIFGEYANARHLPLDNGRAREFADEVPGAVTERIAESARRHNMNILAPLVGLCDGKLRNVTVLIGRDGIIVGQYYKAHLPLPEAEWGFEAGDDIPVFDMDFGRVGVMTCMDIEYPEHALVLMLRGAEMIFFPHVQGSWGEIDWEIRYRARAVDTGLYIVSACYGVEKDEPWRPGMMIGRSSVIGPDGTIMADAGRWAGVLTTQIDLDRRRISDFHFARLCERTLAIKASRRPDLYGELVQYASRDAALAEAAKRGATGG